MRKRRENSLKKYLIRLMGTTWHAQSHEDMYSEGVPDLSFGLHGTNGWIELKQIPKYPSSPESDMKPSEFTSQQVNWITKRGKKAGFCFVLIKVANDYYIFDWRAAKQIRNGATPEWYKTRCLGRWQNSIDKEMLTSILANDWVYFSDDYDW